MASKIGKYLWWAFLALAAVLSTYLLVQSLHARSFVGSGPHARLRGSNNLRIGIVGDQGADLAYIAYEAGLFEEEGIVVDLSPEATYEKALRELEAHEIDLAVLGDVPFGLLAPAWPDIAVLAVIGESPDDLRLVARPDAGIFSFPDLKGKRVGVEDLDSERYAFDALLQRHALAPSDVTVVPMPSDELRPALLRGEIAAVADTFSDKLSPFRTRGSLKEQPLEELVEHKLLHVRYCLVTSWPIIESKRALIVDTLRALVAARAAQKRSPSEAADLVARVQRVPVAKVTRRWKNASFAVTLTRQILTSFEAQERWARQRGGDAEAMDWTSVLAPELLAEAAPTAVKLPKGRQP